MKALKFLKISTVLSGLFCLACVVSLSSLALGFFKVSALTAFFWILNPVGIVCPVTGLILTAIDYSKSKKTNSKPAIGINWIWFIVQFWITFFVYWISLMLWVELTGA